jgi:hypothetical protein
MGVCLSDLRAAGLASSKSGHSKADFHTLAKCRATDA